jgi:hypothetical protein
MADERHGNGRRSGDLWLSRSVKLVVVTGGIVASLAFANRIMTNVDKISALDTRVTSLEQSVPAVLLMTCVMYRDSHPTSLPAVCDQAISRAVR